MLIDNMDLKDKVVVITGASTGLGKQLAEHFKKESSKVVISSRSEDKLKSIASDLGVDYCVADVTSERDVLDLADFTVNKFGQIDVWINNAGIWVPHVPVDELDMDRVHQMVEVNLFGTIHGSKAALIQMKALKSGTIINILSTSALEGRAGSSGYCASKYAVVGFSKSLRLEAKEFGISVLNIYLGGMQTNFFDEKRPDNYEEYMKPEMVADKIIKNLKSKKPEEELIIKRPASS